MLVGRVSIILSIWLILIVLFAAWVFVINPYIAGACDHAVAMLSGPTIPVSHLLDVVVAGLASLVGLLALSQWLTRVERDLAEARAQAARDETVILMATTLTHEIFQPLTTIRAGTQILIDRRLTPEKRRIQGERIIRAVDRLTETVRRIEETTRAHVHQFGGTSLIHLGDR